MFGYAVENHLYFYIVRQLLAQKQNWASWWALGLLPSTLEQFSYKGNKFM
jgi:hypothetical protein